MGNRIAVYTGILDYSTAKGVLEIAKTQNDCQIKVFLHQKNLPIKTKLRLQWRNLKKNGIKRISEILTIVYCSLYERLFTRQYASYGNNVITDFVSELKLHDAISVCSLCDINSEESVNIIREFSPTIGVSIAAPILKKPLLDIAEKGNINLHKGKLPSYRGMPPAFWEIYNGEDSVGCTIHKVTELLDEGGILLESSVKIEKWSTPKGLQIQLDELGVELMAKGVSLILSEEGIFIEQQGSGKTYTKPTLKEHQELIKRISKSDSNSFFKRVIKSIVLNIYSYSYAPVRAYIKGILGKQDVIVLLYHRINDFQRDSLTVGVEQFYNQMSYVRKHFPVASLKSLLAGEVSLHEKKPIIIVTFDDGYADNYDNAFPICMRQNIPCSFFVSTDMVEEGKPFPHDHKLKIRLKNMNWNQLKEMKSNGMYIGSHTCDHLNCAEADPQELLRQFTASQEKLNQELGEDVAILAYPFGGKEHFNQLAQQKAEQAGYSAILSAYGGINHEVDHTNIKRGGIDWMFNKSSFKATLLGWRR
ncbi:polysaccharide deacetylase family protein [Colwelliaceae bacterium 6441]